MASFHGLRQKEARPAGAGRASLALSASRSLAALAALTAAFFAATQLSGSSGSAPAPELPSFLADALGAPQPQAPLVREPAPGVEVAIAPSGYKVNRGKASLSVSAEEHGQGEWRRFAHGVSRPTPFGRETITVEPDKTEQYLTVERRQGVRTWRWTIEAGKLTPRVTPAGAVDFLARDRVVAGFRILPAAIYDGAGKDITPGGVRWSLRRESAVWSLQLRLDDSKLPLPYVIDPATISLREKASGTTGSGGTTLTIAKPTGVVANDFLIAQITTRGGTGVAIGPPDASWTLLDREDSTTVLAQAVYYKVAGASEPISYAWTLTPSQRASGGIIAYYGVDNGSAIDAWSVNTGSSATTVTATDITTGADNHRVVGFFGIQKNGNFTAPAGMTEEYDASSSSTQAMGADYTQATAGPTGNKVATIGNAGGNQPWLAHLVSLKLDIVAPTFTVAVSESPASADQHASGSTLFYRPGGLGGAFTVDSGAADGTPTQSGINKVTFPAVGSGFAPPTSLDVTSSPYSRGYTWLTGATLSGAQTMTAVDNATNSSTGTFTVTPDSAAPSTTDNTGAIGSSWKNTNQTVTLSPGDGSGSGVATTYYTTDGSTPTTSSPQGTSISLTSDGTYTIKYFSGDNVSNSESVQTAGTQIRIDKTLPTSATLDPLPSAIRNGQALTGSATDGGPSGIASLTYYYCAGPPCTPSTLIGSSSAGPSYSVTWNSQPADGDYQVLARASDNAGNTLDSAKRTVTVDNTNPDTTIDSSPPDPSNSSAPSFSFSSNEAGATFECELDSGGFSSCSSPKSYSGLSNGSHTFRVRATDPAGNVDPIPASYTWTIDLTEPNTTIDSSPANPTDATGAAFSFSSNEGGSTFQCELDSGGFSACASPKSYSGLSNGSHTFRVRATDPAGNTDSTPASYTWTVDAADPTSTIAFPASGGSYNTADWSAGCASIGFCGTADGTGTGLQKVEISIRQGSGNYWDGTGFTSASEVWNLTSLAVSDWSYSFAAGDFPVNGNFTFRVRATDLATNTQSPLSRTFSYDTAAPTSLTSFPASAESYTTAEWNAGCATIGFCGTHDDTTSGVQKVEISIRRGTGNYWDGSSFGSASEVWNMTSLTGSDWEYAFATTNFPADGSYTIRVKATDNAGNAEAPSSRTFTYDSASPSSATSFPASGGVYRTSTWNAGCASSGFCGTHSDATSGIEKVEISIRRGAGNYWDGSGFASATEVWNTTALAGSDWSYAFAAASFPADESYTLRFKATDNAGNAETPASRSFTFDASNPSALFTFPAAGGNYSSADWDAGCATSGLCGSHSDGASGVQQVDVSIKQASTNLYWNGVSFSNLAETYFPATLAGSDWSYAFAGSNFPAGGDYVVHVRATDVAGNVEAGPSRTFTYDTTPPETTVDSGPATPTTSTSASFSFSSSESGSSFECELDGAGFSACTSPKNYSSLADGSHTFRVRARDGAGNPDPSPAAHTWVVDTAAPMSTTTFPAASASYNASGWNAGCAVPGFCGTHSDGAAGSGVQKVEISIRRGSGNYWDGSNFGSASEIWNLTALSGGDWSYGFATASFPADGSYTVRVRTTDNVSLAETPASRTFTYDTVDPSAAFSFPTSGGDYRNSSWNAGCATVGFCGTHSDSTSGVQAVEISIQRLSDSNYWDGSGFSSASETFFSAALSGSNWSYAFAAANFPADGQYAVHVRARDNANNVETGPSGAFRIDNADPSALYTFPGAGGAYNASGWNAGCATSGFCGTHSDGGSGVQDVEISIKRVSTDLYWDGGAFASPTESFFTASLSGSSWSYAFPAGSFPADGSYTVHVRARDNAGNTEAGPNRTFTFDTAAPNTVIDSAPANPTSSANASFSFSSSESGSSFECELDGAGFSACTSPENYSLADGSHTFRVRAIDQASNADASPASHTWMIDTAAPSSTVSFPAAAGYYRMAGWNAGCATSGYCGTHSDGSGSGVQKVEISLKRLSTDLYWNGASFANAAETFFTANLSGSNWSYAFAAANFPADGDYEMRVKATDNAGNPETASSRTFTYDATLPSGAVTAPTAGAAVRGAAVTVSSDSSDATSGVADVVFERRSSGGGSWTAIASDSSTPYSVAWDTTSLADGDYDLRAVTSDFAGNSFTSASVTVTVDNTDPSAVTLDSLPSAIRNGRVLTGSGTDATSGVASIAYYYCAGPPCSPATLIGSSSTGPSYSVTWNGQPADGDYQVLARVTDGAGNSLDSAKQTVEIDNTDPSGSLTSPADGATVSGTVPVSSDSADNAGGSGVASATFEHRTSPSGTWTTIGAPDTAAPYSVNWDTASLTDGDYDLRVITVDVAGNQITSATRTVLVDNNDPEVTITSPGAFVNAADPDPFTVAASSPDPDIEDVAFFRCDNTSASCSTGNWVSLGAPDTSEPYTASWPLDADGNRALRAIATDHAGNSDTDIVNTTIDRAFPNTTITASPADPSNDADPSFSFTSSEAGSTFECKLDGGAFAACTSPKSYTGLSAGSHTFEVEATDAAGNTDVTPASHTWTIDLTDPNTTITASPADPSNDADPSFSFTSSEAGSTFECKLDGGAFAACTSWKSYTGLSAGGHTFEVKATDAAGNVDPTPASFAWTIDLTDPNTTITAAPSDPSNNEDPSFSFTSSEPGSTFECKLDAGAFAPCTSPENYTGLGGGSHTFEVKATDAAGNTDATPASHTWTIDLSPPSVNIDSAPGDPSPDTTPTFEFSANEAGSTFECELDGSGFSPCSSPATFGPLGDGNHTFGVQATDPAGNPSSPATYSWLLNSGSPTVSITAPTGFVNAGDADPFTVTATTPDGDVTNVDFFRCDNASVDCATGSWILLGNDPSAPYSAPWPVDADGNRALRAVATDVGSNTGAHVVNVTIDRTLPVTTIGSGPADPSTSPNASFGFSAEAGASFACRLDGGSFAPCTSPRTYTGLGDGAHLFEVRATDAAGNVEAFPPTYGWTIDTAAPQTTISVNPPDPSGSGSADFEFSSSEAGSTFLCELDGAGFSPCASPHGFTGLADGSHTFKVKAVDPAGNPDPTPATYTWLVDATDPDGGLTDPGSPLRGTVTLTATPSDDGAGVKEVEFQYSPADAGSWTAIAVDDTAPFTTPWDSTAAGDGLYDLRVVITDNALNSTASAEVEDRLVDNTDPSATMNDPGADLRGTVALSSSADDGPSGSGIASVAYQRSPANTDTWTAVPQNWDTTSAADGLYDLRVVATDNAGNSQASAPVEDRRVDNTKPGLSSSTPADGSTVETAASVTVVGSETLAGVANATIDGTAAPPPVVSGASVTYSVPFAIGPHTLAGSLEDLAGNLTPIRVHFTVLSGAAAEGMVDFPYTEKNSYASTDSTLAASNEIAEVTVPFGAWTGAAAGDWLVIRIDPRPMLETLATGFQADGDILDVTAYWALAETEVHDFTKPLDIRVSNAASNALPAVLEDSAWRILAQVTGTQLPSAQQDGFYREGTNVHILTRHLSSFALLRDAQNPSRPKNFRGANSSGRLVLRWDAATDNSGLIGSYAVYANGVKIKTLAASARSVNLSRFKTTDARRFQLRAYDAAGNAGRLTYKLAIVPAVKKLTLTDAKSRLVKRGFKAGSVKRAYSSSVAYGRVIRAGKSGLVRTGTGVSLTVSLGSANRASSSESTGTSTGSTSTAGTSGPTSGFTPQAPPAPSSSSGGAPQPPPTSGDTSGNGSSEGEIVTTLEPASQSEGSGLRNALGIALLIAAFLVALGALWRSRRRHQEEAASAAALEPVLFWDTRLLQLATSTVRRLAGRA